MAEDNEVGEGRLIEATEVFSMAYPARKPRPSGADGWWLDIPVPQPETRAPTRQVSARMPAEDLDLLDSLVSKSGQNLTIYLRWLVRVAAAGDIVPRDSKRDTPGV